MGPLACECSWSPDISVLCGGANGAENIEDWTWNGRLHDYGLSCGIWAAVDDRMPRYVSLASSNEASGIDLR